MEVNPVDTGPLITKISEQGALESFMMLVILALFGVAIYLYKDGRDERRENTEALGTMNVTLAGIKEILNALVSKN